MHACSVFYPHQHTPAPAVQADAAADKERYEKEKAEAGPAARKPKRVHTKSAYQVIVCGGAAAAGTRAVP